MVSDNKFECALKAAFSSIFSSMWVILVELRERGEGGLGEVYLPFVTKCSYYEMQEISTEL